MLLGIENEPTPVMTQEQCDALAERIAAVLRDRKKIGDERRRQERRYGRQNNDRALARYYTMRGELRERAGRRVKEIDNMYDAIMSSNAAALVGESPSQNPG